MSKLKKMNLNLKNPQNLLKSKRKKIDKQKNRNKEKLVETHIKPPSKNMINKQSDLTEFIDMVESKKMEKVIKRRIEVKISNSLPMNIGLRKQLANLGVNFEISDKEHHIILFDNILMQIFNLNNDVHDLEDILIDFNLRVKGKYNLIVNIIDFTNFEEKIEGEIRIIKRKFQEFAYENNIKIITIDKKEELYFLVKNIYEHNKNRRL
jgi:hypothetical protein